MDARADTGRGDGHAPSRRPPRAAGPHDPRAPRGRAAPAPCVLAERPAPGPRVDHRHGAAVHPVGYARCARARRSDARPGQRLRLPRAPRSRRVGVPCARSRGGVRVRIAGGTGGQSPSDRSPNAAEEIARRKGEHLSLAAEADVETRTAAGWDDIHLVHDALPDIDASDVDLGTTFLGHRLKLPLVISGMTGGHGRALAVNELLARVAERSGIAIGVGSQRAALRDPMLVPTYSIVRETAPHAFVIANLGISQLVKQDRESPLGAKDVATIVSMVKADALAIHLNYLEESV
ncbi:MAG: hypothetical protein E6I40_13170, partial [Chloroflexi bacterium]